MPAALSLGGKLQLGGAFQITDSSTVAVPVSYLVVGGGGGAGASFYSYVSGGAGGIVSNGTAVFNLNQAYTVSVGAPGAGAPNGSPGNDGGNSVLGFIISTGGKGPKQTIRRNMGLGGNNGVGGDNDLYLGGNDGISGPGGGGAGASSNGGNYFINGLGGVGGSGVTSTILGSSNTYGIGGTGGSFGFNGNSGANGAANTGNGGGGGNNSGANNAVNGFNGNGGSGVVIIQIPSANTATFTGVYSVTTPTISGYKTYVVTATTGTVTVTFS